MTNFIELGKKIYNIDNPREAHRFAVFVARCCLHPQRMSGMEEFFSRSEILKEIAAGYPFVYEQATRAFFYHKSTFEQRIRLIEEHMNFCVKSFDENFLKRLYGDEHIELWKMPLGEDLEDMHLWFCSEPGQRKEGLASLKLATDISIYQIMFWIAPDNLVDVGNSTGEPAMWIGAMQGPNVEDAKELVKTITKKCHSYRTKNLILYSAQSLARSLGLKKIFAVTNEGYYANNHIRSDRKLKTSFGDFWEECGGIPTNDKRFYSLPIVEKRKSDEEIPVRKRAVYRRRFALLDELDETIAKNIKNFCGEGDLK